MSDAAAFRKKMRDWSHRLASAVPELPRRAAQELRVTLATYTPKDTGRAAASWNASARTANYTTKGPTYNSPGTAVKDGIDTTRMGRAMDDYYVANAIDYLGKLNDGHSQKAPAGFIELAHDRLGMRMPTIAAKIRVQYRL